MDFYQLLSDLGIDSEDALCRFGNRQSILERFLLKFPSDPTLGTLTQAAKEKDEENFELYAHTLKGISNNLGLTALGQLCSQSVQLVRSGAFLNALHLFPEIQAEYTRIVGILQNYNKLTN